MREYPLLFKPALVRAILDGQKVQTRRAVKWRKVAPGLNLRFTGLSAEAYPEGWVLESQSRVSSEWRCQPTPCPYGEPGDRIWVKETWRPAIIHSCGLDTCDCDSVGVTYAADNEWRPFTWHSVPAIGDDWTMPKAAARGNVSPLFMPRWAARILLEITRVRVQRLHAISEADALAEGVAPSRVESFARAGVERPAGFAFRDLWTSNGGDWDSNPWVWVIDFRPVTP